mmetsp:Transcript_24167/g.71164  ORF Transcript_24167/g.71164 Transcript_24167/m.71164 type:complete len:221 (-) Transcript_24167:146-808(-)
MVLLVHFDGKRFCVAALGHVLLEGVVGGEPGVVAHEGGGDGAEGAVPELGQAHGEAPGLGVFGVELFETLLALDLHDGLARVDGRGGHAEEGGAGGRRHRLHARGEVLGEVEGVHQLHGARVGRRVAKARPRALHKRKAHATVEAQDAALLVERAHGLEHAHAIPVLVVDGRADPHEGADVDAHGRSARDAAAERRLRRLVENLGEVHLLFSGLLRHGCG